MRREIWLLQSIKIVKDQKASGRDSGHDTMLI